MAARELLDDLATAGVRVWVEGGRLLYKAAPGALTADLRVRVQALRADVVAVLEGRAGRKDARGVEKSRLHAHARDVWPRHPSEQRVDRDLLEDVKAWRRYHPLPAFGELLEAIALAWSKTKPQEKDDQGPRVHHGASLKTEYERLAGWAYYAPEVVTGDWLAEQVARYVAASVAPRAPRVVRELSAEEVEAFAWALGLEAADLPSFPFRLSVGQRVTGPAWLPALQAEIRRGAADPRVARGLTLMDVQGLRAAIAAAARVEEPARLPVSKKRRTA